MVARSVLAGCALAFLSGLTASADLKIDTGDLEVDKACALAVRTLKHNVSEKWGKICPVLAPAWEGSSYPAWIHPFDNFWMNKVTPYLFTKDQVEWPVLLLSRYQWPTGMIGWGIHDCESPEAVQARFKEIGEDKVREGSIASRYIRDHLYIMQVHDLWWHFGDLETARRLFPSCVKSLEYLHNLKDDDKDGLIESADIIEDIDVGSKEGRTGPNAAERFVEQALLYGALVHYAKLADALGEKGEAEQVRARAAALASKVNELYWHEKGYYVFALDAKTHKRIHEEVTSTYGNGYGILWGLVPPERVPKVLDYLTSWDFAVPGPILIPPIETSMSHGGKDMQFKPGVYANGGCGWGRGHLPSVGLALFAHGRESVARDYLQRMARRANADGAFYEYWEWEKYTGATKPGGCRDYSETSSAFLDGVVHGYFGLAALEPGWKRLRFAPKPFPGKPCAITLDLPGGPLTAALRKAGEKWEAVLNSPVERTVEVSIGGAAPVTVTVKGEKTVAGP